MRICVFGAGAIGGYLAGFLARGGVDVSVVARGPHLAALRDRGLTVESLDETFTVPVRASDDTTALGLQDAVLVTVKAPSLPGVAAAVGPLLAEGTPVVFLTNGVPWWYFHGHGGPYEGRRLPTLDPGDALLSAFGARTVGGIAWPASSVPQPGHIRVPRPKGLPTVLGPIDGQVTAGIEAIAKAFETAGLPVVVERRIRNLIWEKIAFNLSAGPMTVLTETTVAATQREAALVSASRLLLAEVTALVQALGCEARIDAAQIAMRNVNLEHRPSILQDFLAGRPMEVEALYNVPLQLASMVGVEMPTLALLAALIRTKVNSREP